jgi:hypothetical protein
MMQLKNMRTQGPPVYFYGHETFPFRHGWLKKGVDAVRKDAAFFSHERAMIELGVGRNMVQAIRYWCIASRLLCEDGTMASRSTRFIPTEIGMRVFSEGGFDPYMEDPATLWLLHWLIASNVRQATTWYWMFNNWTGIEFNKDKVAQEIQRWLEKQGYKPVSDNSLRRDIDCFVRTYISSRQTKTSLIEDSLDCPLVDLQLIADLSDGKTYQFQRGAHPSLVDEVLAFALLAFWQAANNDSNTLAFAKIAYESGSPGRVFKLDEESLITKLERIEATTSGALYYDETSGLKQVYKRADINPMTLLSKYYRPHAARAASRKRPNRLWSQ